MKGVGLYFKPITTYLAGKILNVEASVSDGYMSALYEATITVAIITPSDHVRNVLGRGVGCVETWFFSTFRQVFSSRHQSSEHQSFFCHI